MSTVYDQETHRFLLINQRAVEHTKKYLHASHTVLEIGCGTGNFSVELAEGVSMYHAIDISSGMLEIARSKAEARNIKNIAFRQSTCFDAALKKGSFNIILAYNVLQYFKDFRNTVERINELLTPGGIFISITPCPGERMTPLARIVRFPILLIYILIKIGFVPIPYMRYFRKSELEQAIQEGDFTLIGIQNLGGPEESYFIAAKKKT
jgi:2-polyprenyl-3-methyl-5-hydroxy-6-metoxy-1,4-benzoquinol methylase